MSYETVRARVLDDVRAYLDKIECMHRNSFASHADRIIADIGDMLQELADAAEQERTDEWWAARDIA